MMKNVTDIKGVPAIGAQAGVAFNNKMVYKHLMYEQMHQYITEASYVNKTYNGTQHYKELMAKGFYIGPENNYQGAQGTFSITELVSRGVNGNLEQVIGSDASQATIKFSSFTKPVYSAAKTTPLYTEQFIPSLGIYPRCGFVVTTTP